MAYRRRRRRNPVRATGALVLNPRRRKRRTPAKRRRTTARRRRTNTSHAARSRAAKKGWAKRRRNGTSRGMRRRTASRAYMRTNRKRRNTKRGGVRRTASRAYMRTNRKRRSPSRRRRNVGQVTKLKQSLRKVPILGNSLAAMVGFAPHALFGAVSTEPTMMAVKFAAPYAPRLNSSVFYAGMGLVIATLISRFAPVKPALRDKLALAAASAAGGIAYYKWRTGGDQSLAGEYGMLSGYGSELEVLADGYGSELEVLADGYGDGGYGSELEVLADGMGYQTLPFSQTAGYGAELEVLSGASLADAYSAVGDMTPDELDEMAGWGASMPTASMSIPAFTSPTISARPAFRSGRRPRQRGRRFRRRGTQHTKQSQMAGKRCHRWAWIRCLVGPQRFQQIRSMPPQQRQGIIADLRRSAISAVESISAGSEPDFDSSMDDGEMSGYGALIYGV